MTTAFDRLNSNYYNSLPVSPTNPGGFGAGGHVVNFPAALGDLATVAAQTGASATAAAASSDAALASKNAAAGSATTAGNRAADTLANLNAILLLRDQAAPGRFLTIDRWSSADAHDAFRASFRAEYEALDRACEALTQHEASLGAY